MVKNGQQSVVGEDVPRVPFALRAGAALGVDVVALEELHQRSSDGSILRAHRTEFHVLILITRGRGWHMVDFVRYPIELGHLVHVAPGQVQLFDGEGDLSGFLVLFRPELRRIATPRAHWPASVKLGTDDFEVLEALVEIMLSLSVRQLSATADRLRWRLLSTVLELSQGAVEQHLVREGPVRSREFEAFDALLDESFAHHRQLSWYARELGHSEKTLTRWSRRIAGTSGKSHIDRRVALEAKRLLVHTDHSVESIAVQVGFSESTNFVKFFKRLEGVTPSSFRGEYESVKSVRSISSSE